MSRLGGLEAEVLIVHQGGSPNHSPPGPPHLGGCAP